MSPSAPDDKRVGDETLQRIDDLAGGWTLRKRPERESQAGSATTSSNSGDPAGKPAGPVPEEKSREVATAAAAKKKGLREKTRAKGKERGKTGAGRRPVADAALAPWPRAARGTEKPPQGWASADLRADAEDRAATEVSDRATTRALSERAATEVFDRAATRTVPHDGSDGGDELDHEATRVFGERTAIEIDRTAPARPPPPAAVEARVSPQVVFSPSGRENHAALQQRRARPNHDETLLQTPESGIYSIPVVDGERKPGNTTAVLRLPPSLPRRRGVLGDMVYVPSAFVGVARARRELAQVCRQLEAEKESRSRRLADLARLALADSELGSETVARGREEIIDLEDQRSRRAGAAAAADAEMAALEREREDDKKRHTYELQALRRSAKETEEKLEPLQRRLKAARRRAVKLQENLRDLDHRVARHVATTAGLGQEPVQSAEATIACLRAERRALVQKEPVLAAEIDDLEPAIASLTASLAEVRTQAARIQKEERIALVRTAEKVAAIKAWRLVDERAEAELAQAQEEALTALGERLSVERPPELGAGLRGIEEHEIAMATLDRRHLELTELVRGVDRWALARGVVWLLAFAVAVAAAMVWSFALRAP